MAIKKYFKKEFRVSMFNVEHDDLSDFYLCPFQKHQSPVPLLCLRTIIFLGCLAILISSITLSMSLMHFGHWLIYLTHWGVILITLTSGSAALVSLKAFLGDPNDTPRDLQCYVKIYWVLYNITVPVAFFITFFYWTFLPEMLTDQTIDPVLDVFIHGVNSVVVFVLAVFSRQPSRILHCFQPILLCLIYLVFTIIYYFAGGISPFGDPYIYPILNWTSPGPAIITVVGAVIFLIVMHIVIVFFSLGRNKIYKRYFRGTNSMDINNDPYM